MYKNLNVNSATSAAIIGSMTKARVRIAGDVVQIRPTDRTSTVNMPKTELLRNITVKGNGRRIGLPSEIADRFATGACFNLVPGKYGWFTVQPTDQTSEISGRVSA